MTHVLRAQRKTGVASIFGKCPTRKGLNLIFLPLGVTACIHLSANVQLNFGHQSLDPVLFPIAAFELALDLVLGFIIRVVAL